MRTYLMYALDFHCPICLISSSDFPLKMKEVAAPIRNECVLKSCSLMFRKRKVDFNIDET